MRSAGMSALPPKADIVGSSEPALFCSVILSCRACLLCSQIPVTLNVDEGLTHDVTPTPCWTALSHVRIGRSNCP